MQTFKSHFFLGLVCFCLLSHVSCRKKDKDNDSENSPTPTPKVAKKEKTDEEKAEEKKIAEEEEEKRKKAETAERRKKVPGSATPKPASTATTIMAEAPDETRTLDFQIFPALEINVDTVQSYDLKKGQVFIELKFARGWASTDSQAGIIVFNDEGLEIADFVKIRRDSILTQRYLVSLPEDNKYHFVFTGPPKSVFNFIKPKETIGLPSFIEGEGNYTTDLLKIIKTTKFTANISHQGSSLLWIHLNYLDWGVKALFELLSAAPKLKDRKSYSLKLDPGIYCIEVSADDKWRIDFEQSNP